MPKALFFGALQKVLENIYQTQRAAIDTASNWASEAIATERFATLIGTGHSYLVTSEIIKPSHR